MVTKRLGRHFGPEATIFMARSLNLARRCVNVAKKLVKVANAGIIFSDRLQHPIFRSKTPERRACSQ